MNNIQIKQNINLTPENQITIDTVRKRIPKYSDIKMKENILLKYEILIQIHLQLNRKEHDSIFICCINDFRRA